MPSDPHHLSFAQVRALGRKVSDEFTVPLCRLHHRELHRSRNEPLWWKKFGLDPIKIAAQLWDRTRSFRPPETGTPVVLPASTLPLPETGAKGGGGQGCEGGHPRDRQETIARAWTERAMTTARQLEANRGNALKSTGPRTINGKQASRRNALRHGLTAETLIEPLEDPESYRAFEVAIVAEYLPQSPVEEELVHRLASLFWRLRRATSIETGLLRLQSEILQGFRSSRQKTIDTETGGEGAGSTGVSRTEGSTTSRGGPELPTPDAPPLTADPSRDIAISFLRLANLDSDIVDRLSRYESGLWRQLVQTIFALQTLKRR